MHLGLCAAVASLLPVYCTLSEMAASSHQGMVKQGCSELQEVGASRQVLALPAEGHGIVHQHNQNPKAFNGLARVINIEPKTECS